MTRTVIATKEIYLEMKMADAAVGMVKIADHALGIIAIVLVTPNDLNVTQTDVMVNGYVINCLTVIT